MIYILGISIFTIVILFLVGLLMMVEAKVVKTGDSRIVINDDDENGIQASGGETLLSALSSSGIFIPSACGGGGSCGMCKCKVEEGSRGPLPTEVVHLNRKEKNDNIRLACQLKVKEDLKIQLPPDILDVKKYSGTVVSNRNVATFIKELIVETDPADSLDFKAGAYIQIDIPEYELSFSQFRARVGAAFRPEWDRFDLWGLRARTEEPIFRAYSLANPPSEKNQLRFTVRIATPPPNVKEAPPGLGSTFIFNMKKGDKLTFSGPYGDFFVQDTDREICFVGGGAGMAPMRSHILHLLNTLGTKRRITFWYGARSKRELFYYDVFKELEEKYDNFTYYVAMSDPLPEDEWEGMTGFIHQQLHDAYLADHEDPTEIEYYLCGPPMMIDAVVDMLDDQGVEPDMIAYDKF